MATSRCRDGRCTPASYPGEHEGSIGRSTRASCGESQQPLRQTSGSSGMASTVAKAAHITGSSSTSTDQRGPSPGCPTPAAIFISRRCVTSRRCRPTMSGWSRATSSTVGRASTRPRCISMARRGVRSSWEWATQCWPCPLRPWGMSGSLAARSREAGPTQSTQGAVRSWDGAGWPNVASPDINRDLTALAVRSSTEAWIGGNGVLAQWDGSSWTRYDSIVGKGRGFITGMTVTPGADGVWAVGNKQATGAMLILRGTCA